MLQLMFLSLSRGTEEAVPTMVASGIRKLWISSRGVNVFYIEMLASGSLENILHVSSDATFLPSKKSTLGYCYISTIHVVPAYHSRKRRRGYYIGYYSREANGAKEEKSASLDSF